MLSVTLLCLSVSARSEELASLRDDVEAFKQDARGPYQAIRWFCPDGSVLPAREPCPVAGGLQHALVKERVDAIAAEHGIYLGQILAGTAYEEFLDASRGHARLKQYQLERYLRIVDDGWIHRRARYYRGAVQAEDELAWGRRFLEWLVAEDAVLEQQFFLVRQIAKDLPHAADTHGMTRARVLAKDIATVVPEFMNLRVKIHGRPDAEDAARVRAFRRDQRALPASARAQLWELIAELDEVYQRTTLSRLERYLDAIRADSPVSSVLVQILERRSSADPSISSLSELLWQIRSTIRDAPTGERLALIDLSNDVEAILVRVAGARNARTPRELIDENYILARAAVGCGFIELWEWEMLRESLRVTSNEWTSFELIESADAARRAVAWSTGMVTALYGSVVDQFSQFEPLSRGLIDERIRASILLRFGEAADHLDALAASASGLTHELMGKTNGSGVRGLNPGYAFGELVVLKTLPAGVELAADKIYVLAEAPDDLEPVAGIATVREGNAVSHVQLLARNLGIPNASISRERLDELVSYSGTNVFYAVSPRGSVVLKPGDAMSLREAALFAEIDRPAHPVEVVVDDIALDATALVPLASLRAPDSGVLCGPKAANLGQLAAYFPDHVSAGLVVPFAEFHRHLSQTMPGTTFTYWDAVDALFSFESGVDAAAMAGELESVRESIRTIPFLPGFSEKLRRRFEQVLGREMGSLRVFVRSDTNMEDLEEFTGAGLNLTVAHIEDEEKIFQAIRDVWASPFSERSYRWRRTVLENPLAVFPSVLITPSVNVDKSGVLVTTGASVGRADDLTLAVNWGGGGAVAGQSAETYLLRADGSDVLLSASREPAFNTLPATNDVETRRASFHRPILSASERRRVRELARALERHFDGAVDVELGFEAGRLWLFQVRPFVHNETARSSSYLRSLDNEPARRTILLDAPLPLAVSSSPEAVR